MYYICTNPLSPSESKSQCTPDKDAASSTDIQAPPSINPFDGMKSEDEEEELVVADRQEGEEDDEEVDEAELEAFLDGRLADGLPFLQDGSHQGIAVKNQEHNTFSLPCSKGEDALRTCKLHIKELVHPNCKNIFSHLLLMVSSHAYSLGFICIGFESVKDYEMTFTSENNTFFCVLVAMLKQALFNHMISREAEGEKEETEESKQSGAPGCQLSASLPGSPEGPSESRATASLQKENPQLPSGHTELSESTERNGERIVRQSFDILGITLIHFLAEH